MSRYRVMCLALFLCGSALISVGGEPCAAPLPRTFCNPLNIDYGPSPAYRHAADPVIVLFKDKYYLFSTSDRKGYRVSDDLVNWRLVLWDATSVREAGIEKLAKSGSLAPAVAARGDYLYYFETTDGKKGKTTPLLRTKDPLSGKWEKCTDLPTAYSDPNLFFDDDGRVFVTFGMGGPLIAELDRNTFAEIPGTRRQLLARYPGNDKTPYGIERGRVEFEEARLELTDVTDTSAFLDKFVSGPVREGSWLTKRNGHYYVQWATPGTACAWYCDEVAEADAPLGPYRQYDSPVSMKVGGFISGAGHSCVFKDKSGNWWEVTSMWIGIGHAFERQLGLFPVGFDEKNRMFTDTALGDYPRRLFDGAFAGWWVQSFGKRCTASSSLTNHPPEFVADENVRTWWSAQTGSPGEWLRMDLGKACRVNAVQVNFAEQDARGKPDDPDDYHAYRLLLSDDGANWRPLVDKSGVRACTPHDYVELPAPATGRYLKLENVHTPATASSPSATCVSSATAAARHRSQSAKSR